MQLTVKGKNVEVTDALRDYAEKRIGKIARYFDQIISIDVTLSTERGRHIADVNVFADGNLMRGEERTSDMYTSIDKVLEKLEKQVKKQKEKMLDRQHSAEKFLDLMSYVPQPEEEHHQPYLEGLNLTVRRVAINKLSVEEAIKEMESLINTFLVFHNKENNRINILFKRKEGYGLIDPTNE